MWRRAQSEALSDRPGENPEPEPQIAGNCRGHTCCNQHEQLDTMGRVGVQLVKQEKRAACEHEREQEHDRAGQMLAHEPCPSA
jgi:hypothetical protein